jgi:quercetin dioxygenase-like cupin family protein
MPHAGQTITNNVTGETITWVRTAADTGGAAVVADFVVTGGGEVPAAHVHPVQTETFTVHEGRCRIVVGGVEREAGPGETVVVEPGVAHAWGAITDVRMTVTLEPALRADEFFEELFAITNAGHTNAKGLPTPLRFAVLCDDHRDLVYLAGAPVWLQRSAFAVLAKIGRRVIRRSAPPRSAAPASPAASAAPAPRAR